MKKSSKMLFIAFTVLMHSCEEIEIQGKTKKDEVKDDIMTLPPTELKWVVFDGGENPNSDPDPEDVGTVSCEGQSGNCHPEIVIYANAISTYNDLLDAIDNETCSTFFSDISQSYFDIFPNESSFTDYLNDLQTGNNIMIHASNNVFLITDDEYDPLTSGWNTGDIIMAYPYVFD